MAQNAQNQQRLLTIAKSINPDIIGVGQEPPFIKPTMPNVSLFLQNAQSLQGQLGTSYVPIEDQAFDNVKVEPHRVIPVGVMQLDPQDFEQIQDMVNAKQLEEQLKMLHLKKLYEAVMAGSPTGAKKIEAALADIDEEIELIADMLTALEAVYFSKSNAEAGFEPTKLFAAASARYIENCALLNVELGSIEQSMTFLEALSNLSSIPMSILNEMPNTAIYYQILKDGDHSLRFAFSPSFYIARDSRTNWMKMYTNEAVADYSASGIMRPEDDIKYIMQLTKYRSLERTGIGDQANFNGITSGKNEINGNTALTKLSVIPGLTMIQKVSRAVGYLSREYMLSAGFGRMLGTPLGQSFGIGADPVNEIFGIKDISGLGSLANSAEPDSLADFAIVDGEGNLRPDPTLGIVHLLEGSHPIKNGYETSVTRWLHTVETNPSNNEVSTFDDVLSQALNRLSEAQQLINPVLCRDHDRVLLSPSGLYARCLEAFSQMLEAITISTESASDRRLKATQLAALSTAGKFFNNNTTSNSMPNPNNEQWRSAKVIFSLLSRVIAASVVNESENESTRVFGDGVPAPRWSYKETNTKWLYNWLINTSEEHYLLATAFSIPGGGSVVYDVDPETTAQDKGMTCWKLMGNTFLDYVTDYQTPDSPFNIIAEIYKELCEEAHTATIIDDDTKTFLRIGATTEHAGFDAAIVAAHLFEIFAQLATSLLDIEIAIPVEARTWATTLINEAQAPSITQQIIEYANNNTPEQAPAGGTTDNVGLATQGVRGGSVPESPDSTLELPEDSAGGMEAMPLMGIVKVLTPEEHIYNVLATEEVGILFRGGANEKGTTTYSKVNKLRRFLNELVNAVNNKDLSTLIDSGGKVNAVKDTHASTNFAVHGETTATDFIGEAAKLLREDDAPAKYFAMAKSLIEAIRDLTQEFSNKALQLRTPDVDVPPDVQLVREFESTDLGKKYIRGLTGIQVAHSRRRLQDFAAASESPYVLEPTSNEVYQAIRMVIDHEKSSAQGSLNSILYMGVPAGFYEHVRIADELDIRTAITKFKIGKVDQVFPGIEYEQDVVSIPTGIYITDADVITTMQADNAPENFSALVASLMYNEGFEQFTYQDLLDRSSDPSIAAVRLKNVVRSHLLKKMADIVAGTNFQGYKSLFLNNQDLVYSNQVPGMIQEFYQYLGLPNDFQFFKPGTKGLPGVTQYSQITQPVQTIVDGIDGWLMPKSSQAQLDALFDLSVTKPFYVGNLRNIIFSRTVYDEIFALSYDLDAATIDKMSPYILDRVPKGDTYAKKASWKLRLGNRANSLQKRIQGDPNRFSIDSVYVEMTVEPGA